MNNAASAATRWGRAAAMCAAMYAAMFAAMCAGRALAQPGEPVERGEPPAPQISVSELAPAPEEIQALIRRLGDESFAVRESAAARLLAAGAAALPFLTVSSEDADLEIRRRSSRLAAQIDELHWRRRYDAFIETGDESIGRELAGWRQFQSRIADGREAREFFTKLHQADAPLLAAYQSSPREVGALLNQRAEFAELEFNLSNGGRPVVEGPNRMGQVAAMMFVASDATVSVDSAIFNRVLSLSPNVREFQLMRNGLGEAHFPLLVLLADRALAASFDSAAGRESTTTLYRAVQLSMELNLPCGVTAAKKLLASTSSSTSRIRESVLCLAKVGGRKELAALVEQLGNDKVLVTQNINNVQFQIQARDLALAALVLLTEQDPAAYGMASLERNPAKYLNYPSARFETPAAREAALAKFVAWGSVHLDANQRAKLPGQTPADEGR